MTVRRGIMTQILLVSFPIPPVIVFSLIDLQPNLAVAWCSYCMRRSVISATVRENTLKCFRLGVGISKRLALLYAQLVDVRHTTTRDNIIYVRKYV